MDSHSLSGSDAEASLTELQMVQGHFNVLDDRLDKECVVSLAWKDTNLGLSPNQLPFTCKERNTA